MISFCAVSVDHSLKSDLPHTYIILNIQYQYHTRLYRNMSSPSTFLIVSDTKEALASHLTTLIARLARQCLTERGAFTVALSGGSLPSFLSKLSQAFGSDDPQWEKWYIVLADERCVPESHADSNLGSIREKFLANTTIPASQIYGIHPMKLNESTESVAKDYEAKLQVALLASGGLLDLAVLGFGPDGHTCSLFPNHPLLNEDSRLVAPITDSPKPPPNRITLTFPVLNKQTRHVIICGAGASKGPILKQSMAGISLPPQSYHVAHGIKYKVSIQRDPAPFPVAMVQPDPHVGGESSTLTWIVDNDAMENADLQLDSAM